MNGTNYFLDTNAIIALLKGNSFVEETLSNALWVGISVINVVEFLSYSNLSVEDKELFFRFLQRVEIIDLTDEDFSLLEDLSNFRIAYKLKLPDAIIAFFALQNNATLITNDKPLHKINTIKTLKF